MSPSRNTVFSLYGALRLARFDRNGLTYFDASPTGFLHSFKAALIVAPLYAALLALRYGQDSFGAGPGTYALVELIAYIVAWTAFPVLMLSVVRILNRQEHYFRFIVAYNWAAVLQNAIYIPLSMLALAGVIPADAAGFLGFVILALILGYIGFIAFQALDIDVAPTVGIVAIDFVLSLVINGYTDHLIRME